MWVITSSHPPAAWQALHALVSTHLCNKLGGGESSDHVAACVHVSGGCLHVYV